MIKKILKNSDKNQKIFNLGFTLIELIAVVTLIAIISLLAVPPIINQISKSKNTMSDSMKEIVYSAAGLYFDSDGSFVKISGNVYCFPLKDVVNNNFLNNPVVDPETGKEMNLDTMIEAKVINEVVYYQVNNNCTGYIMPEEQQYSIPIGKKYDFSYTGDGQEYTVPRNGRYKLEVWGAQGGTTTYGLTSAGGMGGYSTGVITLTRDTKLFVYVGGQGVGATDASSGYTDGGFNGGGSAYRFAANPNSYASSGGGGTDFRIGTDLLYARVIVAGGGGGGGRWNAQAYTGGAGGGTVGIVGLAMPGYEANTGGTQTAGGLSRGGTYDSAGTFGTGANQTGGVTDYNGCGGGGGWYGGGSGYSNGMGGGGGSGYVYTSETASNCPSGCLLSSSHYLQNASTMEGNSSFQSPDGTNETGHSGHGYARITYLGD